MHLKSGSASLTLLPERAAFDVRRRILFVADLHLGKASVFRESGIGLPEGADDDTLGRLAGLAGRVNARTVAVLGDLFHARTREMGRVAAALDRCRRRLPGAAWCVVPGNHDRRVAWMESAPWATLLPEGGTVGPWRVAHHPPESATAVELTLCGHLHPGFAVGSSKSAKVALPCFWLRDSCLVLPAFGSFTGFGRVRRAAGDRLWVVCDERVVEIPRG